MLKNKNISVKCVNNHKTQVYHKKPFVKHNMSKELCDIYMSLAPIYQELESAYGEAGWIDLNFYERWLNE